MGKSGAEWRGLPSDATNACVDCLNDATNACVDCLNDVTNACVDYLKEKRMQLMFMGEYNYSIDAKGRLIIPAKLREPLGEKFVITRGLDGCLFIFPNDVWTELSAKLSALPITDKQARQFARNFLRGADCPDIDKQGRILIPASLREAAALTKDVTIIGVGNRIEIWDPKRLEENSTFDEDEIAGHMAELGI